MDTKLFVDRILETENLTDELEDSDAEWLLNWGIHQAEKVLSGVEDDEIAAERITALMGVLRKINRMVGARLSITQEILLEDIKALDLTYCHAFDQDGCKGNLDDVSVGKRFNQMSSRQGLEYLTGRFS